MATAARCRICCHRLATSQPLRQVLAGTRSIFYFNAQGDADLTGGVLAATLSLVLWLIAGAVIVKWHDCKRFYRLHPDVLAYVIHTIQNYKNQQTTPRLRGPGQG
jgi:hypothetical protein